MPNGAIYMVRPLILVSSLLLALLLAACQPVASFHLLADPRLSTATNATIPTPPPFTLAPTAQTATLSAAQIFATISPSVAFIETSAGTGSGVLIEHGYILSNAHVVWPFDKVRVVFPDGSEYRQVPVQSWDLTADLALIGPLDIPQAPIALTDGGELEIGSDVYLIGYPAEVEEFPQPTITNGILSRVRTWDAIDYTFFQVDATTVGGQSGGILVTHKGEVIGVSTFYYGGFGLAGSVADTIHRLNAMVGDNATVEIDMRPLTGTERARNQSGTLAGDEDSAFYLIDEAVDTEIELTISGFGRPAITVYSLVGQYIDAQQVGAEEDEAALTFTIEDEIPYLVVVSQASTNKNRFSLRSSHPLGHYVDPDDGTILQLGKTTMASMELINDRDRFTIELTKDQLVQITVDALEIDPSITLDYQSDRLEQSVSDDDSGGGIFGSNAQLIYRAPEDGTYQLTVDNYEYAVGTYFITVEEAPAAAKVTEPLTTQELYPSGFGPLTWYESEENAFAILRPTLWNDLPLRNCAPGATVCYAGPAVFIITEEPLANLPKRERNREGYLSLLSDTISMQPGVVIESTDPVTTLQKLRADEMTFSAQMGRVLGKRFIFVDEAEQVTFNVSIVSDAASYPMVEAFIESIFESFRYWPEEDREADAVYQLDRGIRLNLTRDHAAALAAFDQSIALDPTLADAYAARGWVHYYLDDHAAAVADLEKALALEPTDIDRYLILSMLHWELQAYAEALAPLNEAAELDPDRATIYNQRALVYVFLADYAAALADTAHYAELSDGELPPSVLDTRAFVYLMMDDLDNARRDYAETYRKDFRSPYTLLGGGITYAKLGELEKGKELITEGYAKLAEEDLREQDLNPQLATLLEWAAEFVARE